MALPIAVLATVFGIVTLAVPAGLAWHFRRRPAMWLRSAADRRAGFHRDALAALDSAIATARHHGLDAEAARLEPARAGHVAALRELAAAVEFPERR